jgi:hypothetical protein
VSALEFHAKRLQAEARDFARSRTRFLAGAAA